MVIYHLQTRKKWPINMLLTVMDHGQELKISGWQMAGIRIRMKRVLEVRTLLVRTCKSPSILITKNNGWRSTYKRVKKW